eukprot:Gb_05008 [translate_table: standard]
MASWLTVSLVGILLSGLSLAIIKLENSKSNGEVVEYESKGWMRECAVWDEENKRFLVSNMEGGLGQISMLGISNGGELKEETVVKDLDYLGNATLGFPIDPVRNRVVVVIVDSSGYKYSALAAYDTRTWQRLYLTKLSGPENQDWCNGQDSGLSGWYWGLGLEGLQGIEVFRLQHSHVLDHPDCSIPIYRKKTSSLANDVDLDPEGNAYVTDSKKNIIWKVGLDGTTVSVLSSPLFTSQPNKLPFKGIGHNGIVYHPDGFLLVVHMWSGAIFKTSLDGMDVSVVNVSSPMVLGDGLALLSPEKLVVVGTPSTRLLESRDGWKSAQLTHRYVGAMHRLATTATIKDGKAFVNHLFGFGVGKRKHVITEAVFKPLDIPRDGLNRV